MQYEEFLEKVQRYAGLASSDAALKIIEVTLGTLSERISVVHRKHLFAQLPKEFAQYALRQRRRDYFSLEEFYNRIAARSATTYHEALKNARALMCVLQESISPGELQDIFSELRDGWEQLLKAQPLVPMSLPVVDTHELFSK